MTNLNTELAKIRNPFPKRVPVGRGMREIDLKPFLPHDWDRGVKRCALSNSRHIQRANGPDSLDPEARLDYFVTDGFSIAEHIPWLHALYLSPRFHAYIAQGMGVQEIAPAALRGGLNINMLAGKGEEYEWHLDAQPFTLVLFATSLLYGDGGELLTAHAGYDYPGADSMLGGMFQPMRGRAICFDGSAIPHKVAALRNDVLRLSVVMELITPSDRVRDPGLDSYLY